MLVGLAEQDLAAPLARLDRTVAEERLLVLMGAPCHAEKMVRGIRIIEHRRPDSRLVARLIWRSQSQLRSVAPGAPLAEALARWLARLRVQIDLPGYPLGDLLKIAEFFEVAHFEATDGLTWVANWLTAQVQAAGGKA